jgi:hypothetical protein
VAEVNDACRAAELPYYLDPEVAIRKRPEGLWRQLAVDAYRVEAVHRFDVDGDDYATLEVLPLATPRGGHRTGLLGLSRDIQPFALVVRDNTTQHLEELRGLLDPPRCGASFDDDTHALMLRCGTMLAELLAQPEAEAALLAGVARHELQHQIDGPLLPMASSLEERLGGYDAAWKARINRELSAHLAQLTHDTPPLRLGLVDPLRFAALDESGVYHHASVLMFEALGRRPLGRPRRLDLAALSDTFDELAALDDAALAERARTAWADLFGDDLPEPTPIR